MCNHVNQLNNSSEVSKSLIPRHNFDFSHSGLDKLGYGGMAGMCTCTRSRIGGAGRSKNTFSLIRRLIF